MEIPLNPIKIPAVAHPSARISSADGQTWQNGFFSGWDATTMGVLTSFTVKAPEDLEEEDVG